MLPPSVYAVRFLHTSDWHLGRSFHGVGLLAAQVLFLDHLVEVVRTEGVDAVVIAGDVYDRALPPPDAVAAFSETLQRIVDAGAQVIVTSGNHDSAIRLGFAGGLLERAGVHLRTSLSDLRPVRIKDVDIHPLPYLEPQVCAAALETDDRTQAGVLRAAMARIRPSFGLARHDVVLAHAFVAGGVGSDSERDLSLGGVSAVPPEVFAGVSYAALGHLHGQQQVAEGVRYSGSPVAMSFGEAHHRKGSLLVDLGGSAPAVEVVPAPVARRLAVLRGRLADLLADPRHTEAEGAWCQVTLTDPIRPLGAMDRVRLRFPHALEVRFAPEGAASAPTSYAARVASRADVEICCDFLGHVRSGAAASPDERALLTEALDESRRARHIRDDEGLVADARGIPEAVEGAA